MRQQAGFPRVTSLDDARDQIIFQQGQIEGQARHITALQATVNRLEGLIKLLEESLQVEHRRSNDLSRTTDEQFEKLEQRLAQLEDAVDELIAEGAEEKP